MSYLIAVSGKGGVGKTTIAGLIINRLINRGKNPVLAIDADPNTCLDEVLDVKAIKTIGGIREEAREIAGKGLAAGISKQELLELKIAECMVEADNFDLIAMGRSEGAGCYCYANNVLKQTINTMTDQYPYVVLDNEAGMENLSRRIVQKVNCLVMVSDSSKRGIDTIRRLHSITHEMQIQYDKLAIVINRMRKDSPLWYAQELQKEIHADFLIDLPDDPELAKVAECGKSIFTVSENNAVVCNIDKFLKILF